MDQMNDLKIRKVSKSHFYEFVRHLGIELRPYQLSLGWAIIKSVLEQKGDEIIAIFARQTGKTETVADVAYFLAITFPSVYCLEPWVHDGFRIGIFAPKKEQSDITFNRIKQRFDDGFVQRWLGIDYVINNGDTFKLTNKSVVHSSTASPTATIEGYTFDLIFVEEAQDVDDLRLTKSIFPMLAATNGTRVLIGTATPEHRGYFYRALKSSKKKWVVDWRMCAKYSPEYREFVAKERKRLGQFSDAYLSQYLLKWSQSASSYVTEEKLYPLRRCHIVKEAKDRDCYYGIDVGKAKDSTVVTVMDGKGCILNWLELELGEDYTYQRDYIISFLDNYRLKAGYIDSYGAGNPMYDILREASPKIRATLRPFNMDAKNKSHAYRCLLQAIYTKEISYPKDEVVQRYKFEEQFLKLEKKWKHGIMSVSHPKGKYDHDDYCDSLAICYMATKMKSPRYLGYSTIKGR